MTRNEADSQNATAQWPGQLWGTGGAPAPASEVPVLLAELRARGISYLSGEHNSAREASVAAYPLPPQELLLALSGCEEPRVRDATIALLLLHPDLASAVPTILPTPLADTDASQNAAKQLVVLALAAMYLQVKWRSRLRLVLGHQKELAFSYWRALDLPAPAESVGEAGLRALAAYARRQRGVPYNFQSAWQDQADHLMWQVWLAQRRHASHLSRGAGSHTGAPLESAEGVSATSVRARGLPRTPRGAGAMSMRPPVDRAAIDRFLGELGSAARQPGRVYLVGGTTMVCEGYRARTLDMGVLVEVDDPGALGGLLDAIRRLKDSLSINVELASPGDFIPLPADWHERSIWIGRFGSLDVFHFDLISVALSKIERGTERDFEDVVALARSGRLRVDALDSAFAEVLPRVATEGVGAMDPERFASQYAHLKARLEPTAE